MFDHIAGLIKRLPFPRPHVLELAAGSGMLAETLLEKLGDITYESIDYSAPMVTRARESLSRYDDRVILHQADLNSSDWEDVLSQEIHVVVSNMAIHDLGNENNVAAIYHKVRDRLNAGGILINADLVLPEEEDIEDDKGKLKTSRHLELLKDLGLVEVQCSLSFGYYACIIGTKPDHDQI
jgi:cyclopropane fatty-acyl-phospholipid synthase-like methyltransferase